VCLLCLSLGSWPRGASGGLLLSAVSERKKRSSVLKFYDNAIGAEGFSSKYFFSCLLWFHGPQVALTEPSVLECVPFSTDDLSPSRPAPLECERRDDGGPGVTTPHKAGVRVSDGDLWGDKQTGLERQATPIKRSNKGKHVINELL